LTAGFRWRGNHGPRHRRRQKRARGVTGSQCLGQCFDWGELRPLGAGQAGWSDFDGGSLETEAGTLIVRRIELRRGTGLRPFECEGRGSCGWSRSCFRPLHFSSHQKCCQENVKNEHCSDEEPGGERPSRASRSDTRTSLADLGTAPFGLVKDAQLNAPGGSVKTGDGCADFRRAQLAARRN
jgi:hypothetical protein